ncbi:MAG: dynamin family protein [Prevotellaceae bacterium]|nr:dynamin family protein [Candidatus Faecinaster equi]
MTELEAVIQVINTLGTNPKCRNRYDSELENFRNRKHQAESNKYRLGVIGVTSSGKSTMINSLLGENLLPAVARPSSSQLVSCFHSTRRSATIHFQDGKQKEYLGNSLNQKLLEKYGDEGSNSGNKEKVKQIELTTPCFPFDDNVILIDSPGLDAYGYAGHEQLTMNSLLPTIDFCIFVTTCKTNSDDKMLSVLNTIAEYEKPVIIVQNMIDSIKPSLDGKKTIADVAQDHRVRVERIINQSNIKDKSKVHIVQISAINALKARQNGLSTKEDKEIFEASNYKKLVTVVNAAFNQVRPIVEEHRLMFLKKEILRIAKAALDDGAGAQGVTTRFQYEDTENQYKAQKKGCLEILNEERNALREALLSIQNKYNFTESDIVSVKSTVRDCEEVICTQLKSLNKAIISVCEKLNIDSRNIVSDFRFDKPELRLKKKTEVVKDGYLKKGERHWYTLWLIKDDDVWVDTSYTKEVTDVKASIQNAINYINSSIRVFNQTIQRWQKSLELTENKLFVEIQNRRSEHEARINQALDCQVYQKIGAELSKIAESIKTVHESQTKVNSTRTDVKASELFTIRVNKELLPMYQLSERMRIKIQNDTFGFFIGNKKRHCVIGWDEYCEVKFIRYAFGKVANPNAIVKGANILDNSIKLIHKPDLAQNDGVYNKGVYLLVNATQIGAAMSEISRYNVTNLLKDNDDFCLVIQDFNEVMNGNSVSETLDNVVGIKRQLNISNTKVQYLLLHDNPVYNLAATEAQTIGCVTQFDEIKIFNDLQKKFNYLLPQNNSERNIVESTIRIIIQKLGKV